MRASHTLKFKHIGKRWLPFLFDLYIDKLEECLDKNNVDGVQLVKYVIKLLLYVDDLILIITTMENTSKNLDSLHIVENLQGLKYQKCEKKSRKEEEDKVIHISLPFYFLM